MYTKLSGQLISPYSRYKCRDKTNDGHTHIIPVPKNAFIRAAESGILFRNMLGCPNQKHSSRIDNSHRRPFCYGCDLALTVVSFPRFHTSIIKIVASNTSCCIFNTYSCCKSSTALMLFFSYGQSTFLQCYCSTV